MRWDASLEFTSEKTNIDPAINPTETLTVQSWQQNCPVTSRDYSAAGSVSLNPASGAPVALYRAIEGSGWISSLVDDFQASNGLSCAQRQ